MRVVGRETSFIPSGHEANNLAKSDLDDPTLLIKARTFEPSESFCDKQDVLVFNTLSEFQEDGFPARIINPGEEQRIYKVSTLATFTNLEANTLAQINVAFEQEQKESATTKYDARRVLHQAKPVLNESSHATFAQLLRDFPVVFSKNEKDIRKCYLVKQRNQTYTGSVPVKLRSRQMPMHFISDLPEKLDKFQEHEFIEPCISPYSAPAMLVIKKW